VAAPGGPEPSGTQPHRTIPGGTRPGPADGTGRAAHRPGPADAPVAFVVPVGLAAPGATGPAQARTLRELLRPTVDSVLAQTDPGRRLYLVGPAGVRAEVAAALDGRRPAGAAPITLCEVPPGTTIGRARDVAVDAARQDGCGFAAFLDPGDRAHPERVAAARAAFAADPALGLVYGDFEPIDEQGRPVRPERLPHAVRVTYRQQLDLTPVEGREGWVRQAVDRECLAVPATRTVRIALATRFPAARAGEPGGADTATLLRYLGGGAVIAHLPGVPTGLLVPAGADRRPDPAEAARARAAERAALEEAITLARARGAADEWFGRVVLCRYLLRLARTADAEDRHEDALALVREARDRAPRTFAKYATLEERSWLPRPGMSRVA
jgi:hypothetical protein